MITRKLGPALAAGCTAVIKPASETPLCAIALQKLAIEAGFPEGSINIVTTDKNVKEVGKEMCDNKKLSKISFTGSTAVGRFLMSEAGNTVKRVSMELGGNAPFIVFEDADIDNAVDSAMATKFRNAGQTCISANRFIVHSKVHDQFVERLAMRMEQTLKVGNGMDKGVNVGPLINQKGLDKVLRHIQNAKSSGAKLIIGGNRIGNEGTFVEPTLLTNISKSMNIHCEETFGPIVGVFKFEDELEAIQLANDTEFGLASYFFSKDINRIWRVAEQLQSGMVGINTGTLGFASTPFGGIKQSGVGVEGSKYGIDEYLSKKLLSMGINSNL
jgi:succinate-semialdehyde dehydrogenase/glutarate-semialdehyde dehydrogenase